MWLRQWEAESSNQYGRGRGQAGYRGRGRGRNNILKCSYCNKGGHSEKFCWSKPKEANYVKEEDDDLLFMTMSAAKEEKSQVWYMDSGCSNHMSGDRSKFIAVDETVKSHVRLGDDKQLKVEGKGTVEISVGSSKKVIKEVHFTPSFAHNLLSVGQLMESGYAILFDDGKCTVKHKSTGRIVACTYMSSNRMFAFDLTKEPEMAMVSKTLADNELWHQRYGHLNFKGLQLLNNKHMVSNLPIIESSEKVCEGCMAGKQTRKSIPVEKSKRA